MRMKPEIHTWRLSPEMKGDWEEAARQENLSVARLLESMVGEALAARACRKNGKAVSSH